MKPLRGQYPYTSTGTIYRQGRGAPLAMPKNAAQLQCFDLFPTNRCHASDGHKPATLCLARICTYCRSIHTFVALLSRAADVLTTRQVSSMIPPAAIFLTFIHQKRCPKRHVWRPSTFYPFIDATFTSARACRESSQQVFSHAHSSGAHTTCGLCHSPAGSAPSHAVSASLHHSTFSSSVSLTRPRPVQPRDAASHCCQLILPQMLHAGQPQGVRGTLARVHIADAVCPSTLL